ncbi:ion transporter [Longimicrobium sp.]|jgi:voltage-gated potassium channel|uniref:ion transporter n=1 Tax=Longimicrobium sp. TaxID=2029185 RepID=UPI002EDB6475
MQHIRKRLHDIIFQHDDPAERAFDVVVIAAIVLSIVVVMLDSVESIAARYGDILYVAEWFFTVLFTIEYLLRLWTSPRPLAYARSFYGVVDLLSVLPTWLSVLFPPGRFLVVLRVLRVLRVFRILKLAEYVEQGAVLSAALRASRYKITVFVSAVLTLSVIVGSLMYLIEGPSAGFTSIPQSVYWAIVTLTTVGYGDIAPEGPLGKALAATLMIMGYGIIAVPTGIVTLELDRASRSARVRRPCPGCGVDRHEPGSAYCRYCGTQL